MRRVRKFKLNANDDIVLSDGKVIQTKGDPGSKGDRGVPGPDGEEINEWSQYPAGLKGDKGDKGDKGLPGIDGEDNEYDPLSIRMGSHGSFADDDHGQYQLESLLPIVSPVILSATPEIDAKVAVTTNLYTVPAGKICVICSVIIRVTAADTITVVPTLGIGVAAGEDDIISSAPLTGLDSAGEMWKGDVEGTAVTVAAAGVIKLGIDTGATATTMIITVYLVGYLI